MTVLYEICKLKSKAIVVFLIQQGRKCGKWLDCDALQWPFNLLDEILKKLK